MYVIGHPFSVSYGMRTHTRVHTRFFIRIFFVESSVYLYLLTQGGQGERWGSDGGEGGSTDWRSGEDQGERWGSDGGAGGLSD